MSDETDPAKSAKRACPYCGERLTVGFGDFLPTRGRGGPVRVTCTSCKGVARLAVSSQIIGVVGFVLGLLAGAIVGARVSGQSEQTTIIVLALAIAGGFFLSFTLGYAFIRFDPEVAPPAPKSRDRQRDKRGKRRKN